MVTSQIRELLKEALLQLKSEGLDVDTEEIEIERPARPEHGDLSSNLAMMLAGKAQMPPRQLAERLVAAIPDHPSVVGVEIAGPGFINFRLHDSWLYDVVREIGRQGREFGRSKMGAGQRIQVEFGSANPTGPIHVGNSRNIIYGDALASLLELAGYTVERENYLNDSGGQVLRFAQSLEARYRQALGQQANVPEDGYQGDYLIALGQEIADREGMGLIGKLDELGRWGIERMVEEHRKTFSHIGVNHDTWASQRDLEESGQVQKAIDRLNTAGSLYESEGAVWFKASEFGHSQDQVIIRSAEKGGLPTYLAADAGYLLNKISRGFDRVIYFWGADHHNTAGALMAVARAFGVEEKVEVIIYQFVTFQGGRLSKRSGEFITLDEMIEEVGADATRFTFLTRSPDSSMVFDFDLVKSQSQENPVYYVQYAHARICSILRYGEEKGVRLPPVDEAPLDLLVHPAEHALIRKLAEYPELIEASAQLRAPYRLATYAQEVAASYHSFYRDCRVIGEEERLTQARLWLCKAASTVLANTLAVLGVSAPERM